METPRYTFDIGFQARIVTVMLRDPMFVPSFRDVLSPGYFETTDLSVAAMLLLKYYDERRSMPDQTTLLTEVRQYAQIAAYAPEQTEALMQSIRAMYQSEVRDSEYVKEAVVKFGRRQAMKDGIYKCIDILRNNGDEEDCRKIMTEATLAGFDVTRIGTNVHQQLPALAQIIRSENQRRRRVPTAIPSLDHCAFGGPCRGEVWVVLGLSGGGKSVWMLNMAAAAIKQGFPVVYYTIGDLEESDVLLRFGSRFTGIPTFEIVKPNGPLGAFFADGAWGLNPFYLRVKYYPSGRPTVETLRAHLAKLRAVDGVAPALVVVDYADELAEMNNENSYQAGKSVYSQLQQLARDFDCLVWTGSQVQRWRPSKGDEELRMDRIGESIKKVQIADGVVSINQTREEYDKCMGRLWVDKVRRGRKFKLIPMYVDYFRMYMTEYIVPPAGVLPVQALPASVS